MNIVNLFEINKAFESQVLCFWSELDTSAKNKVINNSGFIS